MFGTETIFWGCAVAGSVFMLLRVILSLVLGLDDHHHAGAHGAVPGHDSGASDDSFKLVSIHSVGAFFMMFGWTGLTAYKQFELGEFPSIGIGIFCGLCTMALTAAFFRGMQKLTRPGAAFSLQQTVGHTGSVYQTIPADGGRGVVHITINGVLREIDAISNDLQEIKSFTSVHVEKVLDARTVSVKRVSI